MTSKMLKKSASGVLASFRPSTGTRPPHHSAARTDVVLLIRRTVRPRGYASALHSQRPCWANFLSILPDIREPLNVHRATRVSPQPANYNPGRIRSIGLLILFFVVLMGGAPSHESNAMEAVSAAPAPDGWRPLVDPGYRLGAEDVMLVSVWKDEHLTKEVVVRPDGMFSFPLVGDIQAEDRTVEEIRADIVKRLTKYIPNPNVSVAVTKVLSYKVYVVGRVNKPGEYVIGHYTDVLQALSLAGGLTPFAAENDIKVIRRAKGQQQVFVFRYGDVRKGQGLEQNILLQRGDSVMVP